MTLTESEFAAIIKANPALKVRDSGRLPPKLRPAAAERTFDSAAEERYYTRYIQPKLIAGEIVKCEMHVKYEIIPAIEHGGKRYRHCEYTPDFVLKHADGYIKVVEVKGRVVKKLQRDYHLRRQLFILRYCIPNGWAFTEIHDDEI